MLHDDPFLESAGAVVFDEFHERGLESDLALGMVRLIQQTVRPELRIVVMSATLAVEAVAAYLGGCPVVASEGRQYPVEIRYEPRPEHRPWPAAAARRRNGCSTRRTAICSCSCPECRRFARRRGTSKPSPRERDLAVLPLHGDLPAEQQDAALAPRTGARSCWRRTWRKRR